MLECVFAQLCKPLDYFQQFSGFSHILAHSTEAHTALELAGNNSG